MSSAQNWKSDLDCLLKPRTIAVVGATEKVGPGRNTVYNLLHMNFTGTVYPINPRRDEVFGLKCYKSLQDLPEKPDLAVISLPAEMVVGMLEDCRKEGIKAVMVYTSGFAEAGSDGVSMQDRLVEICEAGEMRLCGPNCLGHLNVPDRTGAYSASIPTDMVGGKIAVVSQSGSMAIAMLQSFKGLGVSHVISYGNQAVIELSDYLLYLADDPGTQVIVTFIEGVKDGQRFLDSVRECRRRGKAVIALKTGKSEISKKAVRAHTAAMAGADDVFEAALEEGGVLKVEDLDEMLQTATLLLKSGKAASGGVFLVTISGGQIGMIADIASTIGIDFPAYGEKTVEKLKTIIPPYLQIVNPIDVGRVGSDDYAEYAEVLRICSDDPACGLVLVSQDAPAGVGPSTIDHYSKVVRAAVEVHNEKRKAPLVVFSNHSGPYCPDIVNGLFEAGVPYLQGTRESLKAVRHLIRHSLDRVEPLEPSALVSPDAWEKVERKFDELCAGGAKNFLGEKEGKELLSLLGAPVVEQILCRDGEEAERAAKKLGFPLVMKIESPDIAHKTDVGGVVLGLDSPEKVRRAFGEVVARVKEKMPEAKIDGVTLQIMVPEGIDLIVGTHEDPQFGPVLVYGLGGVYVEIFKDSSLGLIPVSRPGARRMIRSSKSWPLLGEVRGRPALDTAPLEDLMLRLSEFAYRFKDRISAVDLNPVRIGTSGLYVLDALMVLKH